MHTEAVTEDGVLDGDDDEHAHIKAIMRERMDRKSQIVRDAFGYEYRGEEPYPGAFRGVPNPMYWSRLHRQNKDGPGINGVPFARSGQAQIEGKEAEDPDAITPAPPRGGEEWGPMGAGGAVVPVGRLAAQQGDAPGAKEAEDGDAIAPAPATSTGASGLAVSDGAVERVAMPTAQQGVAEEVVEADEIVEADETEAIMPEPMTSGWQAPPEWGVR